MKKLLFLFLAMGSILSSIGQETPSDVQKIYDKIEANKAELNEILNQDVDEATLKNDVEYFHYRMKTLQNYVNGIKKRYADKDYSTVDLENQHEDFKSYYQEKLASFSAIEDPVPSDILGYYEKIETHKADLQKLVSGSYEMFMVEKMLLSFETKEIPKLQNGLNTMKERYDGQDYLADIQNSFDDFIEYFQNFKQELSNGAIDVEANGEALKEIKEVKGQLMMFSQKWDYREEMLQPKELANFVFNAIDPYDWNKMPTTIKNESANNLDAKSAEKYLNNLIDVINTEPHFTNTMLAFVDHAIKVRNNEGYPNKEYTDKANVIIDHVGKSVDFAEKIGGSSDKVAQIRTKIQTYFSSSPTVKSSSNQLFAKPAAGMVDGSLEMELVSYFNTLAWQEKFSETIITSYEWSYQKSSAGIITGRTLGVVMVSKKLDGSCMFQHFTIIQDKMDNGYGKSKKYGVGEQKACSCN